MKTNLTQHFWYVMFFCLSFSATNMNGQVKNPEKTTSNKIHPINLRGYFEFNLHQKNDPTFIHARQLNIRTQLENPVMLSGLSEQMGLNLASNPALKDYKVERREIKPVIGIGGEFQLSRKYGVSLGTGIGSVKQLDDFLLDAYAYDPTNGSTMPTMYEMKGRHSTLSKFVRMHIELLRYYYTGRFQLGLGIGLNGDFNYDHQSDLSIDGYAIPMQTAKPSPQLNGVIRPGVKYWVNNRIYLEGSISKTIPIGPVEIPSSNYTGGISIGINLNNQARGLPSDIETFMESNRYAAPRRK